ncbi:MAG: pilus assembly protein PilM [Usitatibacter sp.]
MSATFESQGARASAWRAKLESFWRWWTRELVQMVPERFAALGGATRVPQLAVEGDEIILAEPQVGAGVQTRTSSSDPQRTRAAVHAMLDAAGEGRGRARLVLAHSEALLRRATMPAATEENLAQVLAFEMDRLTPFRADEVYYDHRVVSRDAPAGTIAVVVAVARRELVDRQVALLRSLGVNVEGVTVREDGPQPGGALDLMPAGLRSESETPRARIVKRALLAVTGLLLLAVLAYPAFRKREAIIALHPIEARAQAEAQTADKLAQELERLVAEYNFLLAKKHGTPPVLAYLEEISRLLPDNTWVQQFDLKPAGKTRELQIQGETASSSKLIEILEQSALIRNASTRGTVTRGSQPGTERFFIAAEAKTRPLPEAVSVAQLASPISVPAAPANPSEPLLPTAPGRGSVRPPAKGEAPATPPPAPPRGEAPKPAQLSGRRGDAPRAPVIPGVPVPARVEPVAPPSAPADAKGR